MVMVADNGNTKNKTTNSVISETTINPTAYKTPKIKWTKVKSWTFLIVLPKVCLNKNNLDYHISRLVFLIIIIFNLYYIYIYIK